MRIAAEPLPLHAGQRPDAAGIDRAARELEGVFAQMMIRSMRDASFGDSLFPGENQLYRDLYDQQLAKSLTAGPGLGLAAMIARQLGGDSATPPTLDARLSSADTDGRGLPLASSAAEDARAASRAAESSERSPMDTLVERLIARARPVAEAAGAALSHLPGAAVVSAAAKAGAAAATGAADFDPRSPEGFVASVWPHAQRAADELGVDPRGLVAQAALETGWGRRGIQRGDGASANNLFGIKAAGWSGERVSAVTHEYRDGVRRNERAEFRAYASPAESFADYVRLLKRNPRYRQALEAGADVRSFAQGLQRAGYATDPAYADKIAAISNGPTLGRALSAILRR